MNTEQSLRRRRGRAIRKARRRRANPSPRRAGGSPSELFRVLGEILRSLQEVARDTWVTFQVIARRLAPLLLTPRDGAGARRQLLHNGRGPRKGRR